MIIGVAGPYSADTAEQRQINLDNMNKAAAKLLELRHVPLIGMNAAIPVFEHANVPDTYKCTMDISLAVINACDALLLLAESPGANKERDLILAKGLPVFKSIDEIIAANKLSLNTNRIQTMQKLQYTININAPVASVFDTMLGITNKADYEAWTAMFNPTSSYEGSWTKGSKMLFVGVDEQGQKGGLVSEIFDFIPNQFVSIRHYGLVQAGVEITEGPDVEKWANGFENYTFSELNGETIITVDLDTTEEFIDYMQENYPKALQKLKVMCEA